MLTRTQEPKTLEMGGLTLVSIFLVILNSFVKGVKLSFVTQCIFLNLYCRDISLK